MKYYFCVFDEDKIILESRMKYLKEINENQNFSQFEDQLSILSDMGFTDKAKNLKYLQMVLDESLRLLPPAVPFNAKYATRDAVLPNGAKVKKGNTITYSPYFVHRLKEYWGDDSEEFCPSRWENPGLIKHPYQFVPFQKGPRICLGMNMAYEEAKCCLVMMFQNGIHFKLVPNQKLTYMSSAVLFSKYGMFMEVEKYGENH